MPASTAALWLVRHAPTADNAGGVVMGGLDPVALPAGLIAAASLAVDGPLTGIPFTRVISSPARRAVATARAIVPELTPRIDARLRERSFGAWEGRSKEELSALRPGAFTPSGAIRLDFLPPRGEPLRALLARVHAALTDLAAEPAEGHTLLVSHNGTLRAAGMLLGLWDLEEAADSSVGHLAPRTADLAQLRAPDAVV